MSNDKELNERRSEELDNIKNALDTVGYDIGQLLKSVGDELAAVPEHVRGTRQTEGIEDAADALKQMRDDCESASLIEIDFNW